MSPARPLAEHELSDEAVWRGLLGRKVTLRYRLHDDPEHPFSEAVGVVQSVAEGAARLLSRRGEVVRVPLEDVLAAKVFSS